MNLFNLSLLRPLIIISKITRKPKKQEAQIPNSPENYHQSYKEYLDEMERVVAECSRVIKKTGVILLNVDVIKFKTQDKNIINLPYDFISLFNNYGLGVKIS